MSEEANGNKASDNQPESSADPREAGMVECPACRGSGAIFLLVTSRPCTRCGGRGWIGQEALTRGLEAAGPEPGIESYAYDSTGAVAQVSSRTYDVQGRLVRETQTGGDEMKTYVLSDADPDIDDDPTDGGSDGEDSAD